MALQSGFYNAMEIDGTFDRVYSADEYTNFYSAFIRDGVRRSGEDDFQVTADGLNLTVAAGYAICGSKWIHNDADYTDLPAIVPPVGDYSRIDAVFIHVDTNEATRAASLILRSGTPASDPQPPAKDTSTGIFELCLCYIAVAPSAESVIVTDKRADSELCGWITTPVGADDFFEVYDEEMTRFITEGEAAFEDWFENVRDTLASVTLFKQYTWFYKSTGAVSSITFNIPQYDPTGVDIINVYINGMRETEDVDYTLSDSTITFTVPKVANTDILVVCYKSIDGAGLGDVSEEITELQNDVAELETVNVGNYICNGLTDNEGIRDYIRGKLATTGDYDTIEVNIIGNFGATNYSFNHSGCLFVFVDITDTSPYFVDDLGHRTIVLNFAKCNTIVVNPGEIFVNSIFEGQFANARVIVNNLSIKFSCYQGLISPTQSSRFTFNNCRFWHNGKLNRVGGAYLAGTGTFNNCRGVVTGGVCFRTSYGGNGILRVNGGEYYAFKDNGGTYNTNDGSVIWNENGGIAVINGVSMPTLSRTGYSQVYAVNDSAVPTGHAVYTGMITNLAFNMSSAELDFIFGTISASMPLETETFT